VLKVYISPQGHSGRLLKNEAAYEEAKERLTSRIKEALGVGAEIEFISEGDEEFVAQYKFLKVVTE
jgi:hypothetical protein